MEFIQQNKPEDKHTFGHYVRQRREELGISVRRMAAELGITPVYLSDIEKGNRYAPKTYMDRMMQLLAVPEEADCCLKT